MQQRIGYAILIVLAAALVPAQGARAQRHCQSNCNPQNGETPDGNFGGTGQSLGAVNLTTSANNIFDSINSNLFSGRFGGQGGSSGFAAGGMPQAGPFGGALAFSPQRVHRAVDEAFSALGYAKGGAAAAPQAAPLWNLWTEARGTTMDAEKRGQDLKADQLNVVFGIDRRIGDTMVLGVVGGYETFTNRIPGLSARLEGEGWSVGPYFGARIGERTIFEASVIYTNLDYDAQSGLASGSFDGERVMGALGLVQTWSLGQLVVEPSVRGYVLHEEQSSFVDSFNVTQAKRRTDVIGLSAGPLFSTYYQASDRLQLKPSFGAYFDWKNVDQTIPANGAPNYAVNDGPSARLTTGLAFIADQRITASVGGTVAGLGTGDHVLWTWQGSLSLRF